MGQRIVQNEQSIVDVAVLAYGRQDKIFDLHKENIDLLTDNTPTVPEVKIPAMPEVGSTLNYIDDDRNREVTRIMEKEKLELATKTQFE